MPRKLHLPKTDLLKAAVYTAVCLLLLLFSTAFLPATRLVHCTPNLLVAAISLLAYYEGAGYAGLFGVIFGALLAGINGRGALLPTLFYGAFALVCVRLYESFFVRNFFAWLCYTATGLCAAELYALFYTVTAWDTPLNADLLYGTLSAFLLSLILSLPLYRLFGYLHRKTELSLH